MKLLWIAAALGIILVIGSEAVARSRQKRVIGGTPSDSDSEQPWLVNIKGKSGGWGPWSRYRYCGGSVINDWWILTAAHCVEDLDDPHKWEVRLASRKLKGGIIDKIGDILGNIFGKKEWKDFNRDVTKVVTHRNYNPNSMWRNDIAMLKMDKAVPSGVEFDQIRAVNLPPSNTTRWPADDATCIMYGWGCNQKGGKVVKRTLRVELGKVNDQECADTWGVRAETRMCAGENYAGIGICPGDSGGPLMCPNDSGDGYMQAGIASFTSKNTPGQRPGAFTRVSMYADWIRKVVRTQ